MIPVIWVSGLHFPEAIELVGIGFVAYCDVDLLDKFCTADIWSNYIDWLLKTSCGTYVEEFYSWASYPLIIVRNLLRQFLIFVNFKLIDQWTMSFRFFKILSHIQNILIGPILILVVQRNIFDLNRASVVTNIARCGNADRFFVIFIDKWLFSIDEKVKTLKRGGDGYP